MEEEKKITVNRDTAIEEFERWAKAWEIGRNKDEFTEKDLNDFEKLKMKIIKAIENGLLIFNDDDDSIEYMFKKPSKARNLKSIKLEMPGGSAITDGDKYEEKASGHRTFQILADMTGKEVNFFKGLNYLDIEILSAIMNIFLAS